MHGSKLGTRWASELGRQVGLRQIVLFHEKTQHLGRFGTRQSVVLAFIVFDQQPQKFEHVGQFVFTSSPPITSSSWFRNSTARP